MIAMSDRIENGTFDDDSKPSATSVAKASIGAANHYC